MPVQNGPGPASRSAVRVGLQAWFSSDACVEHGSTLRRPVWLEVAWFSAARGQDRGETAEMPRQKRIDARDRQQSLVSISQMSMAGRFAFCLRALESCVLYESFPPHLWDPVLSLYWVRAWTDRVDLWFDAVGQLAPFATHPFDIGAREDLGREADEVRRTCDMASTWLKGVMETVFDVGTAHLFSIVARGVDESAVSVFELECQLREKGITFPRREEFSFSRFSDNDGWGRISRERALALRHPVWGNRFSRFGDRLMHRVATGCM